jgi:benzoyl-CoA reductase/2-hydroxyglutaryl-CoA dehydratase subunit BcrC/BadD/HgdB
MNKPKECPICGAGELNVRIYETAISFACGADYDTLKREWVNPCNYSNKYIYELYEDLADAVEYLKAACHDITENETSWLIEAIKELSNKWHLNSEG